MKFIIYWLDPYGKRHFETTATHINFRKKLEEVCGKAGAYHLYGYAKSEIIEP